MSFRLQLRVLLPLKISGEQLLLVLPVAQAWGEQLAEECLSGRQLAHRHLLAWLVLVVVLVFLQLKP